MLYEKMVLISEQEYLGLKGVTHNWQDDDDDSGRPPPGIRRPWVTPTPPPQLSQQGDDSGRSSQQGDDSVRSSQQSDSGGSPTPPPQAGFHRP